jgi:hypothetical protein
MTSADVSVKSSVAPVVPVIPIPAGWSKENRPSKSGDVNANLLFGIREGQSNAFNFRDPSKGRGNSYSVKVMDMKNRKGYLLFFHNGKPFESIDDILFKGLTPNVSERTGNALNGSGLGNYGSVMEGTTYIASNTVAEGKWVAAVGYLHWPNQEFVVEKATEQWNEMEKLIGPELLKEFSVLYFWEIPFKASKEEEADVAEGESPAPGKSKRDNDTLNDKWRNTLSYMLDSNWIRHVKLEIAGQTYRYDEPAEFGSKTLSQWALYQIDKKGGLKKGSYDHRRREVAMVEEIQYRCAETIEKRWVVETDPFEAVGSRTIDTLTAKVEIIGFPGRTGEINKGFYLCERSSTPEQKEEVLAYWSVDSTSAEGMQPAFSMFVYWPMFCPDSSDGGIPNKSHERFRTNPMGFQRNAAAALDAMGIYYDGDRQSEDSTKRYLVPGMEKRKPYAIIRVSFTSLSKRVDRVTKAADDSPSRYEYMDAVQRTALFTTAMPESVLDRMVRAACEAATQKMKEMHPDCFAWFEANFHKPTAKRLPLTGYEPKRRKKIRRYEYFDLQKSSFSFNHKLHCGESRYLVLRYKPTMAWVRKLEKAKGIHCVGFDIQPIKKGIFGSHDKDGKLADAYIAFKRKMGIPDEEHVTVFHVYTSKMGMQGAKFTAFAGTLKEIKRQYLEAKKGPDSNFLVPSRFLTIECESAGSAERGPKVVEVPFVKRGGKPLKYKEPSKFGGKGGVERYVQRDKRIVGQMKSDGLYLNEDFPLFAETLIGVTETKRNKEMSMLLYHTLSVVAEQVEKLADFGNVEFDAMMNEEQWLVNPADPESGNIWASSADFLLNQMLLAVIQTPAVAKMVDDLRKFKHTPETEAE